MSSPASIILDPPRLPAEKSARLVLFGRIAAGVGILAAGAAAAVDSHRFAFSYLTGFSFVVTLALGALVFVMIQHLTRAGWSVAPRRQMEWLAGALPVLAVLFIPIALLSHDLYEWLHPGAMNDHILHKKAAYLNAPFFFVRAAIYLVAWAGLSWFFTSRSRKQDETGDPQLTRSMQAFSAPAVPIYALTITFAGFDWLMSLQPHWYSTIFGVYIFAGALSSALAALALFTLALQKSGAVKSVSTVEHRHDIGKLLFGFTVFYAYISFSQYFLIWYANIPEETVFYLSRWVGSWRPLGMVLVFAHFVIPFLLLLSRRGKRDPLVLGLAAGILLVGHYVDLYWLVMPILDKQGMSPSWIDLAALLAPLGVMAWWVTDRAAKDALYPLRDPRLHEAVQLENV
ncbi:MAG: hypothetical protein QM765_48170 [Myxococcales bacterium]